MKESIKGAVKSKTIWLAGALSALGPALDTFPKAEAFLGDNYGIALIILSGVVGLLRYLTTQPLKEK